MGASIADALSGWSIEGLTLMEVAHIVTKLKMYPYFDVANYVLMCSMVREDSQAASSSSAQGAAETPAFSRRHPFSCWVSSMLMCFASVILANAFVGDSPTAPFLNQTDLITASAVWYLINYSPFDLVYKISKFLPIHIFIYCLKEIQRVHKVHHGVSHTIHSHPHAFALIVAIGVLKGAGYYYMRTLERLVRGNWIPAKNEFLHPSLATKVSLIASVVFILHHEGLIHLQSHLLHLAVVAAFILLRILYVLFGVHNPFHLLENIVCAIFFGGVVDALKKAVSGETTARPEAGSSVKNHGGKSKDD